MTIIAGTVREDQCTFLIISRSVLLRMRSVSGNSCRENQNTHFVVSYVFKIRAIYEIIWKNIVQSDRPQMAIWLMRIACWIPKATNTHSQYVIPIVLPLQQRLHERASMLRYPYIAGPVISIIMIHKVTLQNY
jgi:hypothetical protein